jgi:hypothetical protein
MGATSVTGQGTGSADGFNRGSEHQTLGVTHLIGPKVAAGGTTDIGLAGVTDIPVTAIVDSTNVGFIVLVNDITDGSPAIGYLFLTSSDVFVEIIGTASHDVNWVLIDTGT